MGRTTNHRKKATAHARDAKFCQPRLEATTDFGSPPRLDAEPGDDLQSDDDGECHWDGSVNHYIKTDSELESERNDTSESKSNDEFSDLEGEELVKSLQKRLEDEL